jgi:hypothetical protein
MDETTAVELAAQEIAEAYTNYGASHTDLPIPEVEKIGTYTASFVVENDLGRFRVDIQDIT